MKCPAAIMTVVSSLYILLLTEVPPVAIDPPEPLLVRCKRPEIPCALDCRELGGFALDSRGCEKCQCNTGNFLPYHVRK